MSAPSSYPSASPPEAVTDRIVALRQMMTRVCTEPTIIHSPLVATDHTAAPSNKNSKLRGWKKFFCSSPAFFAALSFVLALAALIASTLIRFSDDPTAPLDACSCESVLPADLEPLVLRMLPLLNASGLLDRAVASALAASEARTTALEQQNILLAATVASLDTHLTATAASLDTRLTAVEAARATLAQSHETLANTVSVQQDTLVQDVAPRLDAVCTSLFPFSCLVKTKVCYPFDPIGDTR